MNNRERVFCSVVHLLYERYLEKGCIEFNSVVFTYTEFEKSYNSMHFGKTLKKSVFNNSYYGHGSKKEKVKFIKNAFCEGDTGYYRLSFPGETEFFKDGLSISKQGWSYLNDYGEENVETFLKKYYGWIKRHPAKPNKADGLSVNESVWLSTAILTFNAYFHSEAGLDIDRLYFDHTTITNLAYYMSGQFAKKTYSAATREKAVRGIGKDSFLSPCQKGKKRITFKRESNSYLPKISDNIKVFTVLGEKSVRTIKKAIKEISLNYYPSDEEFAAMDAAGIRHDAHICVGGTLIRRGQEFLVAFVLKKHCADPITFLEFKSQYEKYVYEAGLEHDSLFVLGQTFSKEILERTDILESGHGRFRYFPNNGRNAVSIEALLDLGRYQNKEISALLLFRRNQGYLLNSGIRNEYEIYDYLRKFGDKAGIRADFRDNLEICFGEASVKRQLLDLIRKYEPLPKADLISMYHQEYGSSRDFIISNLKELSPYLDSGNYYAEKRVGSTSWQQRSIVSKSTLEKFLEGKRGIKRKVPEERYIAALSAKKLPENTAWGRLNNRILQEFIDVQLVCEIDISDDEFVMLLNKLIIPRCKQIVAIRDIYLNADVLFTVGIIQIAIRDYDGSFWGKLANEIDMNQISSNKQAKIGGIVTQTLIKYGKAYVDESEYLKNILMHAFIVDKFAFDFYKYLFRFYELDLDRSVSVTCLDEAGFICDAIKNPYSKRQQMLSEYNGLSIYAAESYCKKIIAAALKAIDNGFWNDSKDISDLPIRLYNIFLSWKNNEKSDFRKAKRLKDRSHESFKKYFSSPLLICDMSEDLGFSVLLPKQLLQRVENDLSEAYWEIKRDNDIRRLVCTLKEGSFGFKTDQIEYQIEDQNIFDKYNFELYYSGQLIRKFTWDQQKIVVFDEYGDKASLNSLSEGEFYGFAPKLSGVSSPAVIDRYEISGMEYFHFNFAIGDILYVPGEANYFIGDVPERGFTTEGLVEDARIVTDDGLKLPIYSKIPSLVMNIEDGKKDGTALIVNDKKYRVTELEEVRIQNAHTTDEKYYYFDLSKNESIKPGINAVFIDIPGTSRGKKIEFVYLEGFAFEFEDAPYINKTRGTLKLNYKTDRKTILDRASDEPEYIDIDFIDLDDDVFTSPLMMCAQKYYVEFKVPLLLYSSNRTDWSFYRPEDYWYTELPDIVYVKYPKPSIMLEISEDNGERNSFSIVKKPDGVFDCDLTKMKSYIGPFHTKQMLKTINMVDRGHIYDFMRIINHSVFVNVELTADIGKGNIFGSFDIVGKGEYYVDIRFANNFICEKRQLDHDLQLRVDAEIRTGEYEVVLYEGEDDEDSFDEIQYHQVGKMVKSLRNPDDLTDERAILNQLMYVVDGEFVRTLSIDNDKYLNYLIVGQKVDKGVYDGFLIVAFHKRDIRDVKRVRIEIPDFSRINRMLVYFMDEYEEVDNLLYDSYSEAVATPEFSNKCNKRERYRRFDPVLWTDEDEAYVWNVEFVRKSSQLESKAMEWSKNNQNRKKTNNNSIWKG